MLVNCLWFVARQLDNPGTLSMVRREVRASDVSLSWLHSGTFSRVDVDTATLFVEIRAQLRTALTTVYELCLVFGSLIT
ncbi:hypothetical protein RRG08_060767 [Elysia crispata]|uniref:Uncharacterized protein n=1 Tax=Elysia crispata TaxID=231223 RepID=A0AAE0Z676_9GAST|nr:hypothetical protein RRG08_060767 [Elysia crispata]